MASRALYSSRLLNRLRDALRARREIAAWLCLLFLMAVSAGAEEAASSFSLKSWRQQQADRPRRIIFNNDGSEIVLLARPTAEDLLALRMSAVAGTQVDSVFYSTTQGFGVFTHSTRVGQPFLTREGRYGPGQIQENRMAALIAAGIDPLRVMIDFSKRQGLEIFCSFRVNDNHDGSTADYGPIRFRENRVKSGHPEYLLGRQGERLKHGSWAAVDYGRPEIRELMFRYVEEVCRNYDVDGVELDFFRHPVFFKATTRGELATAEDRQVMTALMRRIRTMADEVGRARARPLLVATRVPDSVEYSRAIGLELDAWLAGDLLDLLIVAGYFQLNEWDYSVALAHKHGVKVYPSLDDCRLGDVPARSLRQSDRAFRARAASAWRAGADGIYLFNFFDFSDSGVLNRDGATAVMRVIGDPRSLAKLDKDYVGSVRGVGVASGGNLSLGPFQNIETLNPASPKIVTPVQMAAARIDVAETFTEGSAASVTLRLRFEKLSVDDSPWVALNGRRLQPGRTAESWLEFDVASSWLRKGSNEVVVGVSGTTSRALAWCDLILAVRWSKKS